jgi:hypothetical protein
MHRRYGRYVLRHKWFVLLAGLPLRVPLRQLIVHDWSKFTPLEWFGYARFFYGPHAGAARGPQDVQAPADVRAAFDRAWLAHLHRNPHHWQYWVLRLDDGGERCLPMPDRYRREMLADWRGAGRALGFTDTPAWYLRNREHIALHPETRAWVERELGVPAERAAAGRDDKEA